MADENTGGAEEKKGGSGFNIMGLLISVVIAAIVAGGVSFLLIKVLGTNNPPDSGQGGTLVNPVEIRVRFIVEGSNKAFMLKGGSDVVVLDLLKLASTKLVKF